MKALILIAILAIPLSTAANTKSFPNESKISSLSYHSNYQKIGTLATQDCAGCHASNHKNQSDVTAKLDQLIVNSVNNVKQDTDNTMSKLTDAVKYLLSLTA